MSMFLNGGKKVTGIFANVNGETKKIASAWVNKEGVPTKVYNSRIGNRFIAVANNGNTYQSTDGETWVAISGLLITDNYYSLTYGNEKFVCVAQDGGIYNLFPNSKKWKPVNDATNLTIETAYCNLLAYGDGVFVYVDKRGKSYYSLDGETWTALSGGLDSSHYYYQVAYGKISGYGYFVCVGTDGNSYYIRSTTIKGTSSTKSWTAMTGISGSEYDLDCVTYGKSKFVCVSHYGHTFYSTDGKTWTKGNELGTNVHNDITYGNGKFITVGNSGRSYYSTDGVSWTAMTGAAGTVMSVTYGDNRFVCVSDNGRSFYSTDGKTWVQIESLSSDIDFNAVCYSIDGGYDNT